MRYLYMTLMLAACSAAFAQAGSQADALTSSQPSAQADQGGSRAGAAEPARIDIDALEPAVNVGGDSFNRNRSAADDSRASAAKTEPATSAPSRPGANVSPTNPADIEPAVDVSGATLGRGPNAADRDGVAARDVPAPSPDSGPARTALAEAAESSGSRVMDTLDLGTTSITGNQELPKVLYIVPWKRSDLGDIVGRPVNTLLDEVLAPIDPPVFERHLSYYEALYGESHQE